MPGTIYSSDSSAKDRAFQVNVCVVGMLVDTLKASNEDEAIHGMSCAMVKSGYFNISNAGANALYIVRAGEGDEPSSSVLLTATDDESMTRDIEAKRGERLVMLGTSCVGRLRESDKLAELEEILAVHSDARDIAEAIARLIPTPAPAIPLSVAVLPYSEQDYIVGVLSTTTPIMTETLLRGFAKAAERRPSEDSTASVAARRHEEEKPSSDLVATDPAVVKQKQQRRKMYRGFLVAGAGVAAVVALALSRSAGGLAPRIKGPGS